MDMTKKVSLEISERKDSLTNEIKEETLFSPDEWASVPQQTEQEFFKITGDIINYSSRKMSNQQVEQERLRDYLI
jgi:hypothetical protein